MSWMKCDTCDRALDTDYHPSARYLNAAFIADGVVVLCDGCIESQDKVLRALKHALKTAEVAHKRAERTDNAYANSGRMSMALKDIRSLNENIKQAKEDFEQWLSAL